MMFELVSSSLLRDGLMTRLSLMLALAAALMSLGGTCSSPTEGFDYSKVKNRCQGSFLLESGDIIRVNVWNEPNHSRDGVLVRPDGKISLPLVGDLQAAGLSIHDLTTAVRGRVQAFVPSPRVDVSLVTARSYQIYVIGEVRNPGTFGPQSPVNVLQALSMAGGFTPFAKRDRVTVVWNTGKGEARIPFNYDEVLRGELSTQNVILCRGDTVVVP
jgi:polysaccharide biosynthesis/export protein